MILTCKCFYPHRPDGTHVQYVIKLLIYVFEAMQDTNFTQQLCQDKPPKKKGLITYGLISVTISDEFWWLRLTLVDEYRQKPSQIDLWIWHGTSPRKTFRPQQSATARTAQPALVSAPRSHCCCTGRRLRGPNQCANRASLPPSSSWTTHSTTCSSLIELLVSNHSKKERGWFHWKPVHL